MASNELQAVINCANVSALCPLASDPIPCRAVLRRGGGTSGGTEGVAPLELRCCTGTAVVHGEFIRCHARVAPDARDTAVKQAPYDR